MMKGYSYIYVNCCSSIALITVFSLLNGKQIIIGDTAKSIVSKQTVFLNCVYLYDRILTPIQLCIETKRQEKT